MVDTYSIVSRAGLAGLGHRLHRKNLGHQKKLILLGFKHSSTLWGVIHMGAGSGESKPGICPTPWILEIFFKLIILYNTANYAHKN